jgi:predicted thioredoxin/glutaredoxin
MSLTIDIYLSEQCGSYYALQEVMKQALTELAVPADVSYHTISYDDAVSKGIMGSPSIWINGKDAFAGGNAPGVT